MGRQCIDVPLKSRIAPSYSPFGTKWRRRYNGTRSPADERNSLDGVFFKMTVMTGKHAMMQMLQAEGVKYVFGNPGTSESAMMDAIEHYPDLNYVLVTQEGVAVGMADSYGRATGKPAFVNLHIETGLANAISLLHNANEGGSPMVVTSGNKDIRELAHERTDLAAMVPQFTKWTAEATHAEQVPFFLRRAFNEAKTPPTGPTYVGFSANSMDDEADFNIFPSAQGYHRTAPDVHAIEDATRILAGASNPIMIISDRISQSGASGEAVRLAELLGCPVHTTIMHSEANFPESHPQFRGTIRLAYPESEQILNKADAVLLVGKMATGYYMFSKPRLDYFGPNTKLIHIDTDPTQVGTTQRTAVGIVADPKVTLTDLTESLDAGMSGTAREAAKGRVAVLGEEKQAQRAAWDKNLKAQWNDSPMTRERMAYEVARAVPDDTIIADDSVTARDAVHSAFQFDEPQSFYAGRGGALGWGMGGTLGVKLAHPDRPVVGILGDGSAMMTVQGLWTASAYNIPVVYVVCNNGMYRVLKVNMNAYKTLVEGQETPTSKYIGMDFPVPFDIAGMAEAMGVYGRKIENPADIAPEIDKALASGKPAVLDVIIDGKV